MTFLTWYLSGIIICVAMEFLEKHFKDEDIVVNLELILMILVASLFGLILIIVLVSETFKHYYKVGTIPELLKKPIHIFKTKKEEE